MGLAMFLATGGAKYVDVFERVLHNAYAVGLSAEGTAFFYDNPLQHRPDHEQRSGAEPGGEPLRRAWFGCPCCPPNIVRWMAQLADCVAAERDGAVLVAVDAGLQLGTAARVGNTQAWVTNEYEHDGIGDDRGFARLTGLVRDLGGGITP
ncbi:beta-L-arabinofuranosidase domain-containing protein [Nonomuraea sp. B5E05]|uniref:beta-L-arabinofuranosidase domain-containing protein n=1 Tax=Nonomuraea sp. B5E05 TaxID=3153569 RepID=UPI0032615C50